MAGRITQAVPVMILLINCCHLLCGVLHKPYSFDAFRMNNRLPSRMCLQSTLV